MSLIKGIDTIRKYIGVGRPKFYEMVKDGLPAVKKGKEWYAITDEIDAWLPTWCYDQDLNSDSKK